MLLYNDNQSPENINRGDGRRNVGYIIYTSRMDGICPT
jgi:hypothetical protein